MAARHAGVSPAYSRQDASHLVLHYAQQVAQNLHKVESAFLHVTRQSIEVCCRELRTKV